MTAFRLDVVGIFRIARRVYKGLQITFYLCCNGCEHTLLMLKPPHDTGVSQNRKVLVTWWIFDDKDC